jgi:SDR family mycofactocin-dependent oxidoreductase
VTNRVALVTGAARGIGAATVAALAADGWRVVAVDRCADDPALPYPLGTRAELDRVVESARTATGPGPAAGDAVAAEADTRDPEALAAAVGLAEERWGGLDAAVAAAGVIAGGAPAWRIPAEQERAVLDVDLGGVLTLARVAVPALLRRPEPRRGRFLAVASAAATRGLPMLAAYCAAKAGVAGFVRALAAELGGTGVTANAVSPGSTATPILDESARLYGLPAAGAFAVQQPLGRLLSPAEVAAVIVFLAGDGASGMTGAVVPVDGGLALLRRHCVTVLLHYCSSAASRVMSTPVSALLTGQPAFACSAACTNCSAFRPSTSPRTVSLMPVSLKPPAGSGPSDTSACTSSACGVPPAWPISADSCIA